ncbi:hypothetical protein LIA77_08117 [Sarocladium implicatum]|nr:hypothetical protein LIA77_08117 [Sarocladium implicatum]
MPSQARKRPALMQLSVRASAATRQLVPAEKTSLASRAEELNTMRQKWEDALPSSDLAYIRPRVSPHVIAITDNKAAQLETLHKLLARALQDLVERWFSDEKAKLFERMPVEPREEKILRWVVDSGLVPEWKNHAGIWRSDVLFGLGKDGIEDEHPFICELNGRLPINGVMGMGVHSVGISALGTREGGVESLNSIERSMQHMVAFFDTSKAMFSVREKWIGVDSNVLLPIYAETYHQPALVARPQDLELRPEASSPTGYALWDKASGLLLEHWLTEMLQEEWAELDEDVAKHLALNPLNDFRTIMIVHDKRLLGILAEELPGMVERGVLSAEEGEIVGDSIPTTLTPGTAAIQALLEESKADPTLKNGYIYKSCRDGYGVGIEMGNEVSQDDWLNRLELLASKPLRPSEGAAVVQKLVDHHWYDIVRHDVPGKTGPEPDQVHLIASFFVFQDQDQSIYCGPYRTGMEKHLGLGADGTGIAMGAVRVPDDWEVRSEPVTDEELMNGTSKSP